MVLSLRLLYLLLILLEYALCPYENVFTHLVHVDVDGGDRLVAPLQALVLRQTNAHQYSIERINTLASNMLHGNLCIHKIKIPFDR